MKKYLLKRLGWMIPTFFGITLLTFSVAQLAPGDPLQLDPESAGSQAGHAEAVKTFRAEHGLDQPLPVQYVRWLSRILTLDFGRSLQDHQPVSGKIAVTLPRTLALSLLALLLAFGLGVPLGVYSAVRAGRAGQRLLSTFLYVLYALPSFWVAVLLLFALASEHGVDAFPFQGLSSEGSAAWPWYQRLADWLWHLTLPVTCLAYPTLVVVSRHTRAAMIEALSQDYVRAARARGVPERRVIFVHALRNSLLPLLTLLGQMLPHVLGGSVVVERVFGIPGMGLLAFDAIAHRDYPLVMGITTLVAWVTLLSVLLADLAYAWADPRIRLADPETPLTLERPTA